MNPTPLSVTLREEVWPWACKRKIASQSITSDGTYTALCIVLWKDGEILYHTCLSIGECCCLCFQTESCKGMYSCQKRSDQTASDDKSPRVGPFTFVTIMATVADAGFTEWSLKHNRYRHGLILGRWVVVFHFCITVLMICLGLVAFLSGSSVSSLRPQARKLWRKLIVGELFHLQR